MRFDATIEKTLHGWVKALYPSFTVVWDKQKILKKDDVITLNIITAGNDYMQPDQFSDVVTEETVEVSKDKYEYHESLTLSINVYTQANDYIGILSDLKRSIHYKDVIIYFRKLGLVPRLSRDIVDLTALEADVYRFRCQADFVFGYSVIKSRTAFPISRIKGTAMGIIFDETRE